MISQTAVTHIVRGDRGHASACAKAVGAAISRGVGTSGTAKTPSACAWCGAGRQHSGRPDGAKMMPPKPNTPRRNVRAASAPSLCHNHRKSLKLRRRVVTQQKFFCRGRCASGRGATNRPARRAATRQPTAAAPAARRFNVSWIVSASGASVAPSGAAVPASGNTRPLAHAAAANQLTWTGRRHPGHCRRNRDPRPRRSAVAGLGPHFA
jgi:hypothetical protein